MKRAIVFAILLTLAGACSNDEQAPGPDGERFTLVVYLAGDNDLSGEASQKLEAIRRGYDPASGARVFVYIDEAQAPPRLVELIARGASVMAETLIEYEEHNSASAGVFAAVLEEIASRSAGDRFGLVFFSHASGWLPAGALANPSGVGADGRTENPLSRSVGRDGHREMELEEFAGAIPDGMFEYIVMEACYMAGVEVACALRDKTGYILASSAEIVSPGFTNIYPDYLGLLLVGKDGLVPFARAAFDHYDARAGWERSATFSVIDTGAVEELADFIRTKIDPHGVTDTENIQAFDRYRPHLFFDLAECFARVLDDDSIEKLQTIIDRCVVWRAATPSFLPGYGGFSIGAHCGITTYWPHENLEGLNEKWIEMMY